MNNRKCVNAFLLCSILLIAGCANFQDGKNKRHLPELFLKFDSGTASFNNSYALTKRLSAVLTGYEKRPVVVLVASGNTVEDYNLAVSRLFSFSNSVLLDADLRVMVKPLEQDEYRDSVAIYHAASWEEFQSAYLSNSDLTLVESGGGFYPSVDLRYFLLEPLVRTLSGSGDTALQQFESVLKQLGWEIGQLEQESCQSSKTLNSVTVVTVAEIATSHEIRYLAESVVPDLFRGCQYKINAEKRQFLLWK